MATIHVFSLERVFDLGLKEKILIGLKEKNAISLFEATDMVEGNSKQKNKAKKTNSNTKIIRKYTIHKWQITKGKKKMTNNKQSNYKMMPLCKVVELGKGSVNTKTRK